MSLWAVGFTQLLIAISAPNIFAVRHSFKMQWIDATSRPAGVIQLQPRWHRAISQFVYHSMREAVFVIADITRSIAIVVQMAKPQPASRIRLLDDSVAQLLGEGIDHARR